jgi:hypothetical protein
VEPLTVDRPLQSDIRTIANDIRHHP